MTTAFAIGFYAVVVITVIYVVLSGGPMEMARKDRIRRRKRKNKRGDDGAP
jgi:hypothetical protein